MISNKKYLWCHVCQFGFFRRQHFLDVYKRQILNYMMLAQSAKWLFLKTV